MIYICSILGVNESITDRQEADSAEDAARAYVSGWCDAPRVLRIEPEGRGAEEGVYCLLTPNYEIEVLRYNFICWWPDHEWIPQIIKASCLAEAARIFNWKEGKYEVRVAEYNSKSPMYSIKVEGSGGGV